MADNGLPRVAQCFRAREHTVDVRPVFRRLDRRIRARITRCTLVLLLERGTAPDVGAALYVLAAQPPSPR